MSPVIRHYSQEYRKTMSWVHVQIKSYNQETKDIKATQKMGSGSLNNQPWQPAWSVTDVERGIEEWTIRLPDHTKFTQLHITSFLPCLLVSITETALNRAAKKMHAPIWLAENPSDGKISRWMGKISSLKSHSHPTSLRGDLHGAFAVECWRKKRWQLSRPHHVPPTAPQCHESPIITEYEKQPCS